MPWTCPSCKCETELGYNVCRACQTPRPGTEPPPRNNTQTYRPIQFSTARLLGTVTCMACSIAFTFRFAPTLLDPGPDGNFSPLVFSSVLTFFVGATIGTIARGKKGAIVGGIVGVFAGWLIPVSIAILILLYLAVTGQEIMPVPN